jgi:lipoprotein-anchoring transpeptidase ErfK/SrfK
VRSRAANWRAQASAHDYPDKFEIAAAPPTFLSQQRPTPKPYGTERRLHYSVHSGRASSDSGFALLSLFEWEQRTFGLTTSLDIIPLDRTKLISGSAFHGVELGSDQDLPVAVVRHAYATSYEKADNGQLRGTGSYPRRTLLKLTGEVINDVGRYWETSEGSWVHESALTLLGKRESFPSFATGTRKWVDISINKQSLVAYVGDKAVYATLVSTGAGGLGDPEEVPATIRGTFMIHAKHVSSTMDGEEDKSDSFDLQDVPFVQYFHKGFALHGTYWHDQFGRIRSHGCVNLAPIDAAWLFEWTDPNVPAEWHAMINKERGTVVYIRP